MTTNKKLTRIKSSLLSRSMSFAKIGLNAGIQYATTKITNSNIDQFYTSQALHLAKELGELKGSAMKAGQMLSVYGEHFLPAEANLILKTLQSDAPALDWPIMRNILVDSLGDKFNQLDIRTEPIGSASMGQVYLAVEKSTNKKIALKVQYPGVDKSVDSDVEALKKILKLTKLIPGNIQTEGLFEEVKTMLRQELDYVKEAQLTREYRILLGNDSRYIAPEVMNEYCTKNILATEYMEGVKADHPIVQNLSEQRRNKLAENFLDLYLKEIFHWRLIQTDPHLGNYKIQIDSHGNDRIVLLDFGATKLFPEVFIKNYQQMIQGAITNQDELFFKGASGLGFILPTDEPKYIQAFKQFCHETVEPFLDEHDPRDQFKKIEKDGVYDWKKNDLPNRVIKNALRFREFELRTPPQDLVFLDRKTAGVFMFLNALQAKINARRLINPYFVSN